MKRKNYSMFQDISGLSMIMKTNLKDCFKDIQTKSLVFVITRKNKL